MWGNPWAISIEPNNTCNLNCPECPVGNSMLQRKKGFMPLENFSAILSDLPKDLFYINLYFQGEPFLHPDLINMVCLAKEKKTYVTISTNGHFISEDIANQIVNSGLDRLIVSLDGVDQNSYEAYRKGGDFKLVLEGIGNVIEARTRLGSSTPFVILQSLWLKSNENKEDQLLDLCKSLKADKLEMKTAQFYSLSPENEMIPGQPGKRRYLRQSNGGWIIDNKLKNRCFRMWSSCVITWEGKIIPCCFDKDADNILGNLSREAFQKIWKGEAYSVFRRRLLKNRKGIAVCRNCSEGSH